jgi:hypothetical protein
MSLKEVNIMKFGTHDGVLGRDFGEYSTGFELPDHALGIDTEIFPRTETEGLLATQKSILSDLGKKQEEFKKLTKIEIDEAGIKAEIQEILQMDSDTLDALEREVKERLAENREKLSRIYK